MRLIQFVIDVLIDRLTRLDQKLRMRKVARSSGITRAEFEALWATGKGEVSPGVVEMELKLGWSINLDWLHELALYTQVTEKKSRLNWSHGRLLYSLAASLAERLEKGEPLFVLETGTGRGFSAVCMVRAVLDAGRVPLVLTFDALPHNVTMAWGSIVDFEGDQTRRELLLRWPDETAHIVFAEGNLPASLAKLHTPRVHLAFLDAQHSYEAVEQEFNYVAERQLTGDAIVFDDVTPASFPGVVRFVSDLDASKNYSVEFVGDPSVRGYAIAIKR